ncbi:hypothetical protein MUK42_30501 [Musa troglodytarum]|uniref:Uncharacterized protein n=1 Tax=Musa troglodytarum TaxID=320322 RepID=A0A9E7KCD4_9LILI|nr:hypothetical protein MUK42_30501 [Musa troglodytarum]
MVFFFRFLIGSEESGVLMEFSLAVPLLDIDLSSSLIFSIARSGSVRCSPLHQVFEDLSVEVAMTFSEIMNTCSDS